MIIVASRTPWWNSLTRLSFILNGWQVVQEWLWNFTVCSFDLLLPLKAPVWQAMHDKTESSWKSPVESQWLMCEMRNHCARLELNSFNGNCVKISDCRAFSLSLWQWLAISIHACSSSFPAQISNPTWSEARYKLKRFFQQYLLEIILGNPGATSRDDAILLGESLLHEVNFRPKILHRPG